MPTSDPRWRCPRRRSNDGSTDFDPGSDPRLYGADRPRRVGWTTEAFVELFCTGRTSPPQLRAAAKRHPAVVGAYTISGEADALVHLRAVDMAGLEQALEQLRAEPFVTSTRSMIVLSRLVERLGAKVTGPGTGSTPATS